ncbi:MAG: hypothetical protein ACK41E_03120 [Deinococcales bacterium]
MARVVALLTALWLLCAAAQADSAEGTVHLPGAFAEVGWAGKISVPSWVEFRLVATGANSYKAMLETSEGKVLEGLTPIRATLELPEGAGVRATRVLVPLTSTRTIKITLSSASSSASGRFEPSPERLELDGTRLPPDPSLYLAGQQIFGQLEPENALPALAGGAVLEQAPPGLVKGKWGLGAVATPHTALRLLEVLPKYAPPVLVPERRHTLLGFWSVGVFVVLLGLYSLKRHDWRYTVGLAFCSAILAALGVWANQPNAPFNEKRQTVLIGANGWGTRWEILTRFSLRSDWKLPPSAMLLGSNRLIERDYTTTYSLLKLAGWQKISYVLPPKASRVPVRLEKGKLYNESGSPLEKIFVRGYGRQEPLASQASRQIQAKVYETLPWDEYLDLLQVLPTGTVLAQQNGNLLVALESQP